MKRVLSGILSLSLAAGLTAGLSGCGGEDSNALVWYVIGEKPVDHDKVMEKANEIIEPAIGMKLDLRYIDSASFTEKMKLKMASKDPYDLAFTGYVNNYRTAVRMGGLYDITDLVSETGLDQEIESFYLDAARVDGKLYGIPNVQVVSHPTDLEIRQSLAEDCGIVDLFYSLEEKSNIHSTMEDLQEAAKIYDELFATVHEKHPELYTWHPGTMPFSAAVYENLSGGMVIRRDGTSTKILNLYETEEWKLSVQKVREWYENGYIRSDIASNSSATTTEEKKKIAFVNGTWKPGQEAIQISQQGEPNLSAKLYQPYTGGDTILATMVSVGANSKHPKEAVELIKLMNTNSELFNLICWGIEGEHYTKNEDGTVTMIEDSGYFNIGPYAWKYGNQFNGFVQEGQPADVWDQTRTMNSESDKSPLLGFVPDYTPVETELANVTNVESEYGARKSYGTEDMSVWYDEYMSKLKAAGIDKLIAEIQSQYDAWLATK